MDLHVKVNPAPEYKKERHDILNYNPKSKQQSPSPAISTGHPYRHPNTKCCICVASKSSTHFGYEVISQPHSHPQPSMSSSSRSAFCRPSRNKCRYGSVSFYAHTRSTFIIYDIYFIYINIYIYIYIYIYGVLRLRALLPVSPFLWFTYIYPLLHLYLLACSQTTGSRR